MKFITIPLSFEFKTTKVQWAKSYARIKGWWKRPDGTVDGENLVAEVPNADTVKTVQFPFERLPDKEWEQCVAKLSDDGTLERICDADVEQVCSAFEPQLLVRSDRTYDIRYAAPTKPSQPADAWEMRKEFLRLKLDCEKAIAFLNKWGSWDFREYALLSEMVDLQQAVLGALTSPPELWFSKDYSIPPTLYRRSQKPYFTILTDKCEIAIRMTVTSDLLRGAEFKRCARRDCEMPFEVTSKHSRDYCRAYCSHLESVRRKRKTTKEGA
jgi:hypothetical protein